MGDRAPTYHSFRHMTTGHGAPIRLLITAGPTHEPIDRVRFIGNRSSGRLGIALAESAARRGWSTTLLLGPTCLSLSDSRVALRRFQTAADLDRLLRELVPTCDCLVMAAAVADYRPKPPAPGAADLSDGKIRRGDSAFTLDLEPTPDLLAGVATYRRTDQTIIGFALEPRSRLMESAGSKLQRKRLDLIVANPLETMDSPRIEAVVLGPSGVVHQGEAVTKERFAETLLDLIGASRLAGRFA